MLLFFNFHILCLLSSVEFCLLGLLKLAVWLLYRYLNWFWVSPMYVSTVYCCVVVVCDCCLVNDSLCAALATQWAILFNFAVARLGMVFMLMHQLNVSVS